MAPARHDEGLGHGFEEQPRALVLEAAASGGKTAQIAAELSLGRAGGVRIVSAAPSEEESGLPFVVLGDLLRELSPQERAALPAPQRRALGEALLLADPGSAPAGRHAIGLATLSALTTLARKRAVIVAIDDDQWTDAPSARALAFAARRLDGIAVHFLLAREPGAPGGLGPLLAADLGPGDCRSLALGQSGARLTPSETRIADLVATGQTTKQVAATLCLSPRTVEGALTRVYAKIGVRSRAGLAHIGSAPRR